MGVKTVRKLSWFEFVNHEYITLKIIPDSSVRNWRTEDIMRTIAEQYKLPIDRLIREGFIIKGIKEPERASFEIRFEDGKVCFYMRVAKSSYPLILRRLQSVWDKSTIEVVNELKPYEFEQSAVYEGLYNKHDLYSIHTDAKDNLPLGSIMEAGRLVSENEKASIFILFDPIHQISWYSEINEAWEKLRNGNPPRKWRASARELFKFGANQFAMVMQELIGFISDLISSDDSKNAYRNQDKDPESSELAISLLSDATKSKMNRPGLNTYIWAFAQSDEESRADLIARTLLKSYSDLSGDNEIQERRVQSKRKKMAIFDAYENHKAPKINIQANKMSTSETAKLIQIPGLELQEKYREIERIEQTQIEIQNKSLLDDSGLLLGDVVYKSNHSPVYQPTHDIDELCLPHVGIGGMGQGKTRGLLSNYLLQFVKNNMGGIAIDPAKGEIGDELQHAVDKGIIPADKFERINLAQTVFALDFCEALYDERAKARLANIIIHFFNISEETTGQTERFLRAAVIAMESGKIAEILDIFGKEEVLEKAIKRLEERGDQFNSLTLKEYKEHNAGMRRKIIGPIFNRLNDILGDPFLYECLQSDKSLDLVEIMSQRKAVVFDVPARDLDKVAIDLIVNLLSLKIDLSMRMREKVSGEEFPYLIQIDEPHQFSRSTKVWEDAVVESRKFRICYFWTFHYWEQIPNKLQKAIRSALPHYHIYPTTSLTFQSLRDEIYPFTVQDGLKLKRWHAINIIRTGGENAVPFIAKMLPPPKSLYS